MQSVSVCKPVGPLSSKADATQLKEKVVKIFQKQGDHQVISQAVLV